MNLQSFDLPNDVPAEPWNRPKWPTGAGEPVGQLGGEVWNGRPRPEISPNVRCEKLFRAANLRNSCSGSEQLECVTCVLAAARSAN